MRYLPPKKQAWIHSFARALDRKLSENRVSRASVWFDPNAIGVLEMILIEDKWKKSIYGSKQIALSIFMDDLMIGHSAVTSRLKLWAKVSVIRVITPYQTGGTTARRAPTEIDINPLFAKAFEEGIPASQMKGFLDRLAKMFAGRNDFTGAMQGFRFDTKFGHPEPATRHESVVLDAQDWAPEEGEAESESLFKKSKIREEEQRKKHEKAEKARLIGSFIKAAAEIWIVGQVIQGRMNKDSPVPPSWLAENPRELSDVNRREWKELADVFCRYGGLRAGMAWRYFCGTKPSRDEKDQIKFLPEYPHFQWISVDKKPTHFSKHINAIFTDPIFRNLMNDPTKVERTRSYFGDLCDVPPMITEEGARASGSGKDSRSSGAGGGEVRPLRTGIAT